MQKELIEAEFKEVEEEAKSLKNEGKTSKNVGETIFQSARNRVSGVVQPLLVA